MVCFQYFYYSSLESKVDEPMPCVGCKGACPALELILEEIYRDGAFQFDGKEYKCLLI
jgi:hypothetical protein